jgi:hypothetical protein
MTEQNLGDAFDQEAARVARDHEVYDLQDALRRANDRLRKTKITSDSVAEAALQGAHDAVLASERPKVTPYKPPTPGSRAGKPETAALHLTDWQGAKRTVSYNTEVMKERVRQVLKNTIKLVEIQRTDHPVNDIVVMLGGDMIEGLFNFPTQPYEIDATLFDQFVNVATLLDETARFLAGRFANVRFIAEWGNHGRIGSKRAAVPKADNADRMTYQLAKAMSADLPNVTWSISDEDIQRVEVGNYRALLIHGDEVGRNGYASPTTLVKHVTSWKAGGYTTGLGEPWDFRDAYMGHYHTHAQWPLPDGGGNLFQTGSTESDNRYARDNLAVTATPSQRLHFIDPRKGRVTAQYPVWCD